jgi:2-polyprenyl-3-methyl-5-hydroxy-6-metoxy-1,4-benzoquinol methylase
MRTDTKLSAKTEPFDSYWQGPENVEEGYESFVTYYAANYSRHLPADRAREILVVACGPGYFLKFLADRGYKNVLGIDSDPVKVEYGKKRGLNCRAEQAFPHLEGGRERYDWILCEQELNHLTKDEMVEFLELCFRNLRPGGTVVVYGLNGANPITGAEALAQNFDHFNTFTEYSLKQLLEIAKFHRIEVFPLKLYVFYENPLNYVGLVATGALTLLFRVLFKLYGKSNRIFTKKIGAIGTKLER